MPLIELRHTPGALDGVDRDALVDALTEAASTAEGTDLERVRSLTWVTFDAPDDFHGPGPAFVVRVSVAEGLLDSTDRETLVAGVTDAIDDAVEDCNPMAVWVVVDVVPDGHWGAGGAVVSSSQIAALTGGAIVE